MDFSCSHLTLDDRKMRSAALLGQSWLMPFFECWMWRKRTLTDDLVIQNPSHDFEPMPCVHTFPLFELVNQFMMGFAQNEKHRYRQSDLSTKSKEFAFQSDFDMVFPGLSTVSKRAVRIGGVWNGSCVETFLLPPPRNVLHSSEVQEFAMFTGLFCARLAGFPCQLGEKTIHCSCSCCARNVWTTRYEFSEHRFFFGGGASHIASSQNIFWEQQRRRRR